MSDNDSFSAAWGKLTLKDDGFGVSVGILGLDGTVKVDVTYEETRRLHEWLGQRLWRFDEFERNKRTAQ